MGIATVDVPETKKIIKRAARNAKQSRLEGRDKSVSSTTASTSSSPNDFDTYFEEEGDGDEEDAPPPSKVKVKASADDDDVKLPVRFTKSQKTVSQTRLDLSETAVVGQRYGLSLRATAHVSSSVLLAAKKAGIISPEASVNIKETLVIDKNKIKRENDKVGSKLKQEARNEDAVRGLYFDGRKDEILTSSGFEKEEHISLVSEPGSKYIGHVAPTSSSALAASDSIYQYVTRELNCGFDEVVVVGCDGTNTNTGWKGGIIRLLEEKLDRPLQWAVCLLHFNELPLRHLFIAIDGPTAGPNKFSGPIGSQLSSCETLAIVKFKSVKCDLPEMDPTDLSNDQRYMYEIADAIRCGECSPELASRLIGPINMARWLTTANRVLRLYISTKRPTNKLKLVVQYLLTVYVPLWFRIRRNKSIGDGCRHLFQAIKLSRFLPLKYREVVNSTIQTNAFFAMPENLLLGMVTDSRLTVRQDALTKILQAKQETQLTTVRFNIVPKINFEANDYTDMIKWDQTDVSLTLPPVLMHIPEDELTCKLSMADGLVPDWEFTSFPCHTVAVERTVKLVTEVSKRVIGPDARDRQIRSTLLSRKAVSSFGSKKDFVGAIDDKKS
ncbi:Tetratricopeptide repeat protein 30-like protein [Frankliniella fusca]|uniref:Tetratricopeptide repeat protein 30-like protein n=1 Tax=Frankliniella fusca TaxID=407009 RepID=A0AAE1HQ43_9NEOP|nr:Tetratricopeptide repeat protein 30-like protein [Frankliniella fusca]